MTDGAAGPLPRRHWEWLALPAIAGAASALLTWNRWIRPYVDGSRELQVPARVAEGERLYRDVAYYYGPAAPWANAAAVDLFGRSFGVFEAMGALAALVLLASLYRLARRAGSPLSAGAAVTAAAAVCIGAPNGGSFLFPYAFAALYAVAAGFASLAALAVSPTRLRAVLGAVALALALLAKAEVGAAAAAVILVAGFRYRGSEGRVPRRRTLAAVLSAGVLATAGYGFAFRGMSLRALATEGPLVLLSPPSEWRQVYELISGMDDASAALSRFATALFLDALVVGAAWLVAKVSGNREKPGAAEILWWALLAGAVLFCATAVGGSIEDRLPALLSPAPLAAALGALSLLRPPFDERTRARWLLFGFSALVAVRVWGHVAYGFVTTPYTILALPGLAASSAVLLIDVLGPALTRPAVFRRALAAACLAFAAAGLVRLDRIRRSAAVAAIETTAGELRLPEPWGRASALVLEFLGEAARPGDTLTCFPECGVFNFVTGLRNPLRQEQILPGHLDAKAEADVAERIRTSGPRFVVLVDQAPPGWAAARFGVDYAREIARVIAESYVPAGAARAPDGTPLIRVLERRTG